MAKLQDPKANISLGRAFKYCLSTKSYKVWLIIGIIISVLGAIFIVINSKSNGFQAGHQFGIGGCLLVLLAAILFRPCEIAANTTNEQADRGNYIGF